MSKVVRLTESDLVRLVKKVLKEQISGPGPDTFVKECFMEHANIEDLSKIPTCSKIAMGIIKTKKLPTNMEEGIKCATEIVSTVGGDPFGAFGKLTQIGECILKKVNSPVKY